MNYDFTDPAAYEPAPNNTWLYVAGGAMVAGSIICYISASANKKKARATSFQFQMNHTETLKKGAVAKIPLPSLSFKVAL